MQEIITSISTVGFPIVAAITVGYYCKTLIDKVLSVVDRNTEALSKVLQALEMQHNNSIKEED